MNTKVGCHSLLQGFFLTQGLNLVLLHCGRILYHLSHQGSKIWSQPDLFPLYCDPKIQDNFSRAGARRPRRTLGQIQAAEIVGGKLMGWEPVHIGPLWGSLAVLCRLTAASPFTKHGAHACPGWQAPLWRASVPLLPDSPPNQPQDRTLALWRPCS